MKEMTVHRSEALKKVDLIINGPRAKTHGNAYDTHTNIAAMWNILLRKKLKEDLVASAKILGKDFYLDIGKRAGFLDSHNKVDNVDNKEDKQ